MGEIQQQFRITLGLDWHSDPVIDCIVTGANLKECVQNAKDYANDLAAFTSASVKSVDLVNGHTILGFIKIPI